ncbi:MAG: ribonuclease III [Cellvibrionaceae bacterium]|nr:ribonuclease III [Cellvibrionaceae bacterium]
MSSNYHPLQEKFGYHFDNLGLLKLALTHRSYSNNNNERLEFLGDALLNSTIAQKLYFKFPDAKEGVLSRLRASLVKGKTLSVIARHFAIGDYLIMGAGELKSGGSDRDSILADVVEALIGAVFIDSDLARCQGFIEHIFQEHLDNITINKHLKDPKTRLQELLQAQQQPLPNYTIVHIGGVSHKQEFTVSCTTALLKKAPEATAASRRQAEQLVAEKVLQALEGMVVNGDKRE